eukprot:TRINITY_DN27206_c0_g3_i3.p1 TRINITY_DN27206_c0_g3~~TRINITY_DN27206_c0_g3_i3.p1  ORF type:complete len:579 (+),score=10.38 TRINITY_DN27206_c0_g3_i3:37-1737(+)
MRGDNLLPMLDGLAEAPELKTRAQRREAATRNADSIPVFFDLLNRWIVFYPRPVAIASNIVLLLVVAAMPFLSSPARSGYATAAQRWKAMFSAAWAEALTWGMAFVVPVLVAIFRVAVSGRPLSWYSHPPSAFAMFVPASIIGILLPHVWRAGGSYSRAAVLSPQQEAAFEWSGHWGNLLWFVGLAMLVTMCGAGGGFIGVYWSLCLLPALFLYRKAKAKFGDGSPITLLAYLLPATIPCLYNLYFSAFFTQLMAEKMGASGAAPMPWGLYVPDIVLACFVGIAVCITIAPYAPILSRWIGRPAFLQALLYVSLVAAAHTSTMFPYTLGTPKRVVLQRVYATGPAVLQQPQMQQMQDGVVGSGAAAAAATAAASVVRTETTIATADCNDASYLLKHIPGLRDALVAGSNESAAMSLADRSNLRALYPVSDLIDRSYSFPAPRSPRLAHASFRLPAVRLLREEVVPSAAVAAAAPGGGVDGNGTAAALLRRRLHLELDAGSLDQVWAAVLNITGPVTAWSLTPTLPPRERSRGGPPSLMVHYSGGGAGFKWSFWVEVRGQGGLVRNG